jgi:tetratricopeptide (TPR) repeat protein
MYRLLSMTLVFVSGCATTTAGPTQPDGINDDKQTRPKISAESLSNYLAGTIFLGRNQIDEAAEAFRKAAEKSPDSRAIRMKLITMYLKAGDLEKATKECEAAAKQIPGDQGICFILGKLYEQAERFEEANRMFERANEIKPDSGAGYEAMLSVAEKANDLVSVTAACRKLIELDPGALAPRYRLGIALTRMNDLEGARDELLKAVEIDPDSADARYVLGLVLLDLDDNAAAVEQLEKVRAVEPEREGLVTRLAGALARGGRDSEAADLFRKEIEAGRGTPGDSLQLMCLLLRLGKYEDALKIGTPVEAPVTSALLRASAKQSLVGTAVSTELGAAGGSIQSEFDAINTTESDADEEFRTFLGQLVYLSPGKKGEEFLARALSALRSSGVKSRWLDLAYARTLMARDVFEGAEPVLQLMLSTYGEDKNAHLALATIYEELERDADCEKHLLSYLKLDPDNPEALNFLGYLYADKGRHLDEAERLIRRALEKQPDNGYYLDSLGWVFYRRGNADEAISYIGKAILRMPEDDAELRDHLGDAYLLKGDVKRAVREWERALRLNPKLAGVEDKLQRHRKETGPGNKT